MWEPRCSPSEDLNSRAAAQVRQLLEGFTLKVAGVVRQVQNHRTISGRGCHSSDVPRQGFPPPRSQKHNIREERERERERDGDGGL